MKILAILMLTISSTLSFSAPPTLSYYQSVSSLSGYELKRALKLVLKQGHNTQSYGALINVYFSSDLDRTYEQDGTLMDMYSENPRTHDQYNFRSRNRVCGNYKGESDCFNREHLVPQSVFHEKRPMVSDFFHVYPTDGYVNGRRGSHPFGEVAKVKWESSNGSKLGKYAGDDYSGTVFEPIDEFKGDIARALMYFAVRYEDGIPNWRHDMFSGSRRRGFSKWFIKVLLRWNKLDPVSKHEIHRNNIGFRFQGNRNPFIDHPEWADKIWNNLNL